MNTKSFDDKPGPFVRCQRCLTTAATCYVADSRGRRKPVCNGCRDKVTVSAYKRVK